jgi:hypothetical protein
MSVLASPEYVSSGSRMTWTGGFGSFLFSKGPSDLISSVSALLKNNYALIIERYDSGISAGGLGSGSMTLYLRTDQDRGDGETDDGLTDIGQNVRDTCASQGFPPSSWAIDNYQPANTDGSTSTQVIKTGTAQKTVEQNTAADKSTSSVTSWWDNLTGKLEAGSVGVLIGGAVVIGLILFLAVKQEV